MAESIPSTYQRAQVWFQANLGPFLTPYYVVFAGAVAGVTGIFAVVIILIVLVTTNFNVLGWIE